MATNDDPNIYLYTEASPLESVDTGEGFFPQAPGVTLSDGTILFTWKDDPLSDDSTGTGIFDPFLSLLKAKFESGTNFYQDGNYGTGDAISAADNRTKLIELSYIPVIKVDGTEYLEIRLDLNESGGGPAGTIKLEEFKIYGSNDPLQSSSSGTTLLYSIDTAGLDRTIHMFDDQSGSGRADIVMLIPKSYFSSNPEYVFFEAKLADSSGGFEEFGVYILQAPLDPSITVTKTALVFNPDETPDVDGIVDEVGDVIQYTITLQNPGDVPLTGIALTDPFIQATLDNDADDDGVIDGDTNDNGELDVGETWTYTGSYTVTQAMIDSRGNYDGPDDGEINDDVIRNTVFVETDQGATDDDSADVAVAYEPEVLILKTADVETVDEDGDVINYTITVENVGNVTLTNVLLTDTLIQDSLDNDADDDGVIDGDTNDNGELDVGETWTYTGSYTVTQADIDANGNFDGDDEGEENDGIVRNLVSVVTDQGAQDEDEATVDVIYDPLVAVTKTASVSEVDEADDVIDYTVTVENIGNVTLTGIALTDPFIQATLDNDADDDGVIDGDTNDNGELDVGETWTYTGSYTVTQAMIDSRGNYDGPDDGEINDDVIRNTVFVETDQGATDDDSADVAVIFNPDVTIVKSANVETVDEAGDIIEYTISVTNVGNATLDDVVVIDDLISDSLTNDADEDGYIDGDINENGLLDVGETWVWSGQYIVTEDDIAAAQASMDPYCIENTASVDTNLTDPEDSSEEVCVVRVDFEGLSHGYWKNHVSDWDGLTAGTSFESFFFGSQQSSLSWVVKSDSGKGKDKFNQMSDITMMQALSLTGGAEAALAREAVAAILNIRDEDVTYHFTEDQVKEWVTEALTGQSVDLNNDGIFEFAAGSEAIMGVKDLLDANNNLGLM